MRAEVTKYSAPAASDARDLDGTLASGIVLRYSVTIIEIDSLTSQPGAA